MLLLTRKLNEIVMVGEEVQVKVINVDERKIVTLGFIAPDHIKINRIEKIFDKVKIIKNYKSK